MAAFDRNGDEKLTQSELARRPELFAELAGARDAVYPADIERRINRVTQLGVEAAADDFVPRWDLDGDGRVEPEEMPDVPTLALRGVFERR